jgi:hypothetical protein
MKAALLAIAAGVTVIAAPSAAQKPTPKSDSTCVSSQSVKTECRIYWDKMPGDSGFRRAFYRMDSAAANRPVLGLELRATGTRRDTLGVFVEAVTPKGPAEAAGIVEGDRIAAINGVDLRSSAADIDDPYTNGIASHRLSREVRKLTPGSRVTVRVYSGGRFRDVQVVAGKASDVMRYSNRFNFRVPGPGGMMEFDGPGGPPPEMMMLRTPLLQRFKQPGGTIRLRSPSGLRQLSPSRAPQVIRLKDASPLRVDAGSGWVVANSEIPELEDENAVGIDPEAWLETYDDVNVYDDIDVEDAETFEMTPAVEPPK